MKQKGIEGLSEALEGKKLETLAEIKRLQVSVASMEWRLEHG
ncbi:hypothetical protein [Paenibacillus aestuarii]|uniref:Uncharacterized protein n=1 Tax=Paenibacillus aestuarii TaxID=516965 RepID=A0ABW0KAI5_9BACL|nr:hypothetical protein [Paenibacillus aestuarii]